MRRSHQMFTHHHRGSHHRGGRHRQRARRGAVRDAVLTLLAEQPMHGYELITELEERSGGRWRPSAGSIYPALSRMEQHGLIASEEVDGKRRFTLTEEGRERLDQVQAGSSVPPWEESGRSGRGDLRRHIAEIVSLARQVGRFGTADQIERAARVLDDTRQSLAEIVAEDRREMEDGDDTEDREG